MRQAGRRDRHLLVIPEIPPNGRDGDSGHARFVPDKRRGEVIGCRVVGRCGPLDRVFLDTLIIYQPIVKRLPVGRGEGTFGHIIAARAAVDVPDRVVRHFAGAAVRVEHHGMFQRDQGDGDGLCAAPVALAANGRRIGLADLIFFRILYFNAVIRVSFEFGVPAPDLQAL